MPPDRSHKCLSAVMSPRQRHHRRPVPAALLFGQVLMGMVLVTPASWAADTPAPLRLQVDAGLQALVDQHIHLQRVPGDADDEQLRALLLRDAQREVGELLATEGYFSPQLRWQDAQTLQVEAGVRSRIRSVDLQLRDDRADALLDALRRDWALPVDRPFRQDDWQRAKQQALQTLIDAGYAAARISSSEAHVRPETQTVDLALQLDSGPLHVYGAQQFSGLSRYAPALLRRYTESLQPGQTWNSRAVLEVQQALQATPYFEQVGIDIDVVDSDAGQVEVPVRVQVREREPHRLSLGIGASSNNGARVQLAYNFPDLFGRALDFGSGFRLEENRQQAFADLFLPRNRDNSQDSMALLFERSEFADLDIERRALRVMRSYPAFAFEQRYSLTVERADETAQDQSRRRFQSVVPGATFILRNVDDLRRPRRGGVLSGDVAVATDGFGSDTNFFYALLRADYYLPVSSSDAEGRQWLLNLRGEFGGNWAGDDDEVPQSYLFRTGGSQSVRGYDYLSIGREENGSVFGTSHLLIASGELVYWWSESWGSSFFYDLGTATDTLDQIELLAGYGIGLRWQTPAGPLAFDIARGERDSGVHFHFNIAIPF